MTIEEAIKSLHQFFTDLAAAKALGLRVSDQKVDTAKEALAAVEAEVEKLRSAMQERLANTDQQTS